MLVNAIEGIIENGKIRLTENVTFPENAKVYIIFADSNGQSPAHVRSPKLADQSKTSDFRKQIVEVSPDAKL